MAERYGAELAGALPEAAAVLSFDDYTDIGARLDDVLEGRALTPTRRATGGPCCPSARSSATPRPSRSPATATCRPGSRRPPARARCAGG